MLNTDQRRETGYAWGSLGRSGEWLTILGSAHRTPALTAEAEDAVMPQTLMTPGGVPQPYTLAKVDRAGGRAFRVLEVVREAFPENVNA